MEVLITLVGGFTLFNILNKKEKFEETYYDSESYYKQNVNNSDSEKVNKFSPRENGNIIAGDNNIFADYSNTSGGYPIADFHTSETQEEWIQKNSLNNKEKINGVLLKDYYEKYTNDVLEKGHWFLNKDQMFDNLLIIKVQY